MDCANCQTGIQLSIEKLLTPEFSDTISSDLEGSGYCEGISQNQEEEDQCALFVSMAVHNGLPFLAADLLADVWMQKNICNHAVQGTC